MARVLRDEGAASAVAFLDRVATVPENAPLLPFFTALRAVLAGRRDRTLADAPDLHYRMSAELLLIDTLERQP
jgi:hypothetical protein